MTVAAGTAARTAASAASMVAATVARSVSAASAIFAPTRSSSGSEVLRADVNQAVDVLGLFERRANGLVLLASRPRR